MKTKSQTRPEMISVSYNRFRQESRAIAFDIIEQEGGYEYETVTIPPGCWTKGHIISAIIQDRYPQDKMEAIINNYLNDMTDTAAQQEMTQMQSWRIHAKEVAARMLEADERERGKESAEE